MPSEARRYILAAVRAPLRIFEDFLSANWAGERFAFIMSAQFVEIGLLRALIDHPLTCD